MEATNTARNWTVTLVAVAIIVIGFVFAIRHARPTSAVVGAKGALATTTEVTSGDTEVTAATGEGTGEVKVSNVTTATTGELLTVSNQKAGSEVKIDSLSLTRASWVAIRDSKDWVLGAAWFPAGATSGTVSLLRNTVAGEHYTAVIYIDNGDKKFQVHGDSLVTGADGVPGSASFTAQ